MDNRSRRSLSKHEGVYRGITNGYRPNQRRNFSNVPRSLRGKHKRRAVSRKGKEASPRILADFLAETPSGEDRRMKIEETKRKEPEPENTWKLFTDGASSFDGSRAGLMLVSPEGK
ncbi:hypothetical protein Tco_0883567 [Tanacetum coccineum]